LVNLSALVKLLAHRTVKAAYVEAMEQVEALHTALRKPLPPEKPRVQPTDVKEAWDQDGFEAAVARAREYIAAGDCMQVVLSRRVTARYRGDAFALYRTLRSISPTPYLFFLRFGDRAIAGASPELLVRLEDGNVTVRPIAGTRRRGVNVEEDRALEAELRADPKERAEHVMLVDLGRNDIGRVAAPGTVRVEEREITERYSHVMHLVSQVTGKLQEGLDAVDVVAATFPAGTVSGAPKVRAMEIIDELEPCARGPYAGAVGYFGHDGAMDLAITIRSLAVANGELRLQAGAGVVHDSVPAHEHEETAHKMRATLAALGLGAAPASAAPGKKAPARPKRKAAGKKAPRKARKPARRAAKARKR
jgi:anthranilate synthase component 1